MIQSNLKDFLAINCMYDNIVKMYIDLYCQGMSCRQWFNNQWVSEKFRAKLFAFILYCHAEYYYQW